MSKPLQSRELYDFGAFRLDAAERALTKNGQVIPLTPKAFDTLVVLVRNSGHVVEKDELLKEVWPDTFVEEGVLAVNVAAIRKALSDGEEGRSYIETVPRRGYRFIGEVQAIERNVRGSSCGESSSDREKKSSVRAMGACGRFAGIGAGWLWLVHFPVAAKFNSATVLSPSRSPAIPARNSVPPSRRTAVRWPLAGMASARTTLTFTSNSSTG